MARCRFALLALTLVAVSQSVAHASSPSLITCVNGWGHDAPLGWCAEGFVGQVFPSDLPYGNQFPAGTLFLRGFTSAGERVRVLVSDGVQAVEAEGTADEAGRFEIPVFVSDLGTHVVAPGADPFDPDPAVRGVTTLMLTAWPAAAPQDVAISTVKKYAGSFGDVYRPLLRSVVFPPREWCHGSLIVCPVGEYKPSTCSTGLTSLRCSTGEAVTQGRVFDDSYSVGGRASEIADITITVTHGKEIIETISGIAARPGGTSAIWAHTFHIDDFEPNWTDEAYRITVRVRDAWGNTVTANSGDIFVYPW